MNFFTKKSDRNLVEALRRTERFRRPGGLAFIILGLAFVGFHVWLEVWMKHKALQIADVVSDIQRSVPPSENPDQSPPIAYAVGFRSGLLFSQGMIVAGLFLGLGIRLLFAGRKDRMLIRYFDLATNSQAAQKTED